MNWLKDIQFFFTALPTESKTLLTLGFVCILLSTLLFIKNSKWTKASLFLSAILVSSAFATMDPFFHTWDESFHALVSKNTSNNFLKPHLLNSELVEYYPENWIGNYIWLHKPPLSLWQIGISIDILGANIFAVRLPSIILFSSTVILVYDIATTLTGRSVAFYSALLYILFHFSLEQVAGIYTSDHIDVSFTFYITASLWAWCKHMNTGLNRHLYLIGLFSGMAILTKWLVGLLIFGSWGVLILVLLFFSQKEAFTHLKKAIKAFLVAACVSLPWNVFAAINYPNEYWHEFTYARKHFTEIIEGHGGGVLYYWENISTLFGGGLLIPALIVLSILLFAITIRGFNKKVVVLAFICIPYVFFTLAATKMENFVNIVSPVILIAVAVLIVKTGSFLRKKIDIHPAWNMAFIVILFPFLLRPNQSIKNHLFEDKTSRSYLESMQNSIKELSGDSKVYIYSGFENYEHIIHMYYHESVAIPHIPEARVLEEWRNQNIPVSIVYINEKPALLNLPDNTQFIKLEHQENLNRKK